MTHRIVITMISNMIALIFISGSLMQFYVGRTKNESKVFTLTISRAIKSLTQIVSSSLLVIYSLLFRKLLRRVVTSMLLIRSPFKFPERNFIIWKDFKILTVVLCLVGYVTSFVHSMFFYDRMKYLMINFVLMVSSFSMQTLYTLLMYALNIQLCPPILHMVETIRTAVQSKTAFDESNSSQVSELAGEGEVHKEMKTVPLPLLSKVLANYRRYFLHLRQHVKQQNSYFTPVAAVIILNSMVVIIAQIFLSVTNQAIFFTPKQISMLIFALQQLWMICMVGQNLESAVSC